MRIKALVAALLLLCTPAFGQATKATINAEIDSNLPTNGDGLITASILRTTLKDFVAASNFQADFINVSQMPAFGGDCTTPAGSVTLSCTKTLGRTFQPYSYINTGTGLNATATGFSNTNQALWLVGNYSASGSGPYALISVADQATNTTYGVAATALWVAHNINSGAGAGNRTSFSPILTKNVATPGTDKNLKFYVPHFSQFYINSGDGGSVGNYYGAHYGGAALVQAQSGATYLETMQGFEIDVSIQAGANSKLKNGLLLAGVNSDSQHGDTWEAFLAFTRDGTSSATWNRAIDLFYPQGQFAFDTNSTILGSSSTGTIGYGVDFSNLTVTNSAFKSPGFNVSGLGATSVLSLASTGAVSGTTGTFTGAVSGTTGTFSGDVSAPHFKSNVAVPTATTCGTSPTVDAGSSNHGGKITFGSATTACTLTFASAFPTNAYCTVTPLAQPAAVANIPYISAQSRTAFTISGGTASAAYQYNCQGN